MNDVVEVVENESGKNVVRHEDAHLDLFLKMHEKVNSRSEEISKSYSNNLLIKFDDIEELHHKTIQSIKSLQPQKSTVGLRIAVTHNEGESEKFNSFEKFCEHNKTSPNPTLDVILVYKFTIYDSGSNEFENYRVINHLKSRVAELKQLESEAPPFISSALISSMVTTTAKITIQYDDYVKARHFTAMFDEWIRGCDESKNISLITSLKSVSHLINRFGKLTIYGLLALFTAFGIEADIITGELSVQFIVIYAAIFVIAGSVAETFLSKAERSIDSYLALSYLKINKGDSKLIDDFESRNKSSLKWSMAGVLGTVAVGVLTSSAYEFIKWLIIE